MLRTPKIHKVLPSLPTALKLLRRRSRIALLPPHFTRSMSPRMHREEAKSSGSRETVLVGLKLVIDIAEKASDVIPIHKVNVVIGGLQVLLERQEVRRTICISAVTDHSSDQC